VKNPNPSDRLRNVLAFFVLTFAWTWGLWGAVAWLDTAASAAGIVLMLLSGFGPSVAAIILVALSDGREGLRQWLRRCFTWRLAWGWYGLAFFGPPVIMLAALGLNAALGGYVPPSPAQGTVWMSALVFAQILVLGGPLGEEFGWRGYALPVLAARWGWRWASVAVGAIWAFWHLPLFFMAGTAQANLPQPLFLASTMALSVIFARLAVNTAFSVLPAVALHWSINAWSWAMPVTPQNGVMQPYQLVMALVFAGAVIAVLKPGPGAPAT
jgi:uncharacterized protein